ncbi:hypothetical protein [Vulcanisaeta thermophila]|uniref:hypothetical protein n=1 Tax=Vulcanisaeta thermophila TaxID=867917 RepID=UPI0013899867|nr:hypothetical protein [Vulcanisaeta thermophila]
MKYQDLVGQFSWNEAYQFLGLVNDKELNIYNIVSRKVKDTAEQAVLRVDSNWSRYSMP